MIQSNFIKYFFVLPFMAFVLFVTLIFTNKCEVYAAVGFDYYSYSKIYNQLPKKYQKDDYIYVSDGVPLITFATYNDHDYRTSVKKSDDKDNFIYCCDYSKHIVFGKIFTAQNNLFKNNDLRARIGTALHNGTTEWGKKASSQFTTGNFITDYYMTQVVIHSLIYKYGGDFSSYGVKFDSLKFKSDTDNIKKKAKALYDFCCKSTITLKDGNFQNPQLTVVKPNNNLLSADGEYLYSDYVTYNYNADGAVVKDVTEKITCETIAADLIKDSIQIERDENANRFRIKIPISEAEKLGAGVYELSASVDITFERNIAGFWKSSKTESQETTGLITNKKSLNDNIAFKFMVIDLNIKKTDSITGSIIPDATFDLYQFNDATNDFDFYKNIPYNANTMSYRCNAVSNVSNNTSKFKVIESKPGKNYKLDWDGSVFHAIEEITSFEMNVQNEPIMGSLTINKKGEAVAGINESEFVYNNELPLEGVTFSLYAADNIHGKDKILFKKDDFIVNLVTDKNGMATVHDLPAGNYYFKETETLNTYFLDPQTYNINITRDNNTYSDVNVTPINALKKCRINILKYDRENDKKLPLSNARFGLYCGEPIYDYKQNIILEKDSLIGEKTTDDDGNIVFSDLPYADYYIKELKAPEGYMINDGIIYIKKTEFNIDKPLEHQPDPSKQQYEKDIDVINTKQLYCLKIYKSGEKFTGIDRQTSEYGDYITYNMQQAPLENVVFALYSEDGTQLQKKETDKNGIAYFPGLPVGKYYYTEEACPDIYNIKKEKREVIISSNSNTSGDYYTDNSQIEDSKKQQPIIESNMSNTYCDASLGIRKNGEAVIMNEKGLKYNIIPMENVVFGIYQTFDYVIADNISAPKESCVGYLVTGENGTARYKGKLPEGQYYVKEIKTASGYEIDGNQYSFELKANNHQSIDILLNNNNEFINYLSKTSVQIIKTDADTGKKLKGVEFTLYNENSQSIGVYKTDKKGEIFIDDLPYGNYYFVETKAKHGYYSTNNKYKFSLNSPEGLVLNITNAPILKLGFEEHYRHALTGILVIIAAFSFIIYINGVKK